MKSLPTTSVIIPTYNRKDSLLRLLNSIAQQTFPMDRLDVFIVDDGSSDDTYTITGQSFPFTLHYLQQKNQGATAARNYGATASQAEVLVFIDDDMSISPNTLEALAEKCAAMSNIIVMGTINKRSTTNASTYTRVALTMVDHALTARDDVEFHPVECNSELLACKRTDFFDIGMFQDPTAGNGWPNWDDVDFGYRAHLKGFRLVGASRAMAEHWDYSISNRTMACQRFYRAGRSAVWLFNRHPDLQTHIPMLRDKIPPNWAKDRPQLIARKFARRLASSALAVGILVKLVTVLEKYYPSPVYLSRLYYLLHGANLFQGYRQGLREFQLQGAEK